MVRAAMLLTMACLATTPVWAEACEAPNIPEFPVSGADISVDVFNDMTAQLILYDDQVKTYRVCLDQIILAPSEHSPEIWLAALNAYNDASGTQAALYDQYTKVDAEFREAQSMRASAAARRQSTESIASSQTALAEELAELNE